MVVFMAKSKERERKFEDSLSALEGIVSQLESGDLPLERALELFEEGIGLARHCQSQLQEAERKVELLLRERGEIKVVPFETVRDGQIEATENLQQRSSVINTKEATPNKEEDNGVTEEVDDSIPF